MSEAFDSETARTMASALSLAIDRLGSDLADIEQARSILARAIIEATEKGERDAEKLAVHAVAEYKKTCGQGSSNEKSVN